MGVKWERWGTPTCAGWGNREDQVQSERTAAYQRSANEAFLQN